MSQERTERGIIRRSQERDSRIQNIVSKAREVRYTEYEEPDELEEAYAEIDRLNTTIEGLQEAVKEQTAKVQEQGEKLSLCYKDMEAHTKLVEEYCDRQKEIVEADAWTEYWRQEAFRQHPTQEAYDAVCKALEKHRARANAGDREVELQGEMLRALWEHQQWMAEHFKIRLNERDKIANQHVAEIGQLRAEIKSSIEDLRKFFDTPYKDMPFEAQKIADRFESILKGKE